MDLQPDTDVRVNLPLTQLQMFTRTTFIFTWREKMLFWPMGRKNLWFNSLVVTDGLPVWS